MNDSYYKLNIKKMPDHTLTTAELEAYIGEIETYLEELRTELETERDGGDHPINPPPKP